MNALVVAYFLRCQMNAVLEAMPREIHQQRRRRRSPEVARRLLCRRGIAGTGTEPARPSSAKVVSFEAVS